MVSYINSWSSSHHLRAGKICNGNPISTFPTCCPFQISTELFHWEVKFKQSWWSDSDVHTSQFKYLIFKIEVFQCPIYKIVWSSSHLMVLCFPKITYLYSVKYHVVGLMCYQHYFGVSLQCFINKFSTSYVDAKHIIHQTPFKFLVDFSLCDLPVTTHNSTQRCTHHTDNSLTDVQNSV